MSDLAYVIACGIVVLGLFVVPALVWLEERAARRDKQAWDEWQNGGAL